MWYYTSHCSSILLCKLDLWNGQCLDQSTPGQDGHCPLHKKKSFRNVFCWVWWQIWSVTHTPDEQEKCRAESSWNQSFSFVLSMVSPLLSFPLSFHQIYSAEYMHIWFLLNCCQKSGCARVNATRKVLIYAKTRGLDPVSIFPVIKPSLQMQPDKQITCAAPPATEPWPHSNQLRLGILSSFALHQDLQVATSRIHTLRALRNAIFQH